MAIQEQQKKKEEQEIKRSKESAHQQSLGKLEKASNFNSKLDELRYKRYMDEIERKERQKELEIQTKKIALKDILVSEVERQKEIKSQTLVRN